MDFLGRIRDHPYEEVTLALRAKSCESLGQAFLTGNVSYVVTSYSAVLSALNN